MQRLRAKTPEIPHHVRVPQMSLRVPLLAMDEGRKLICPEEKRGRRGGKKKVYNTSKLYGVYGTY